MWKLCAVAFLAVLSILHHPGSCCNLQNPTTDSQTFQEMLASWCLGFIQTGFIGLQCHRTGYVDTDQPNVCDRPCKENDRRVCHFFFNLETTEAHDPIACGPTCARHNACKRCIRTDGVNSPLLTANYRFPTKPLVACANDLIWVEVANNMKNFEEDISVDNLAQDINIIFQNFNIRAGVGTIARLINKFLQQRQKHWPNKIWPPNRPFENPGEPTTYHWHGMLQKKTPYIDGVQYVTQQVISPGMVYRYLFEVSQAGTFFMHSHLGMQRGIGLAGAMVFREIPSKNQLASLYDHDRTSEIIFLTDFGHDLSSRADVLLINGRGRYFTNELWQGEPYQFNVKRNTRYRFRVIFNGITNLQVVFSVDDHKLTLIAVDGNDVKPVTVGSIVLANAERADFVLHTDQDVGSYYMRVCSFRNPTLNQVALLNYNGETPADPYANLEFTAAPQGLQFNKPSAGPGTDGSLSMSELEDLKDLSHCSRSSSCHQYFLDLTVTAFGPQINKITMEYPDTALLKQILDNGHMDETNFCNAESLVNSNCDQVLCSCTHMVKLVLNQCYEFILIGGHPFHLHGHTYHVVAMGVAPADAKMTKELFLDMDTANQVQRNLRNPPAKDTVLPPTNGYAVIRFCADNPGVWAAHCHIELHSNLGMLMAFKVGTDADILKTKTGLHRSEPVKNNLCVD